MSVNRRQRGGAALERVGLALLVALAGYWLTARSLGLLARTLAWAGLSPSDAVVGAAMLGFPTYLIVLLLGLPCRATGPVLATLGSWWVLLEAVRRLSA